MSAHLSSFKILTLSVVTLALSACASSGQAPQDSKDGYNARIDAALERAAHQADRDGANVASLALMERLYKRDPKNPENALKFAHALRNAGDLKKATLVLDPFAAKPDASTEILTEMATLFLNDGKFVSAETMAARAIAKDANNFRAYQMLGIAHEGQKDYKPAEVAFRQALDLWQGDPIPVMNNLALNLTNQERLPEALEIMERAKAAAPNRIEVERNLRIIRTLNETASGRPAPHPSTKPAAKTVP